MKCSTCEKDANVKLTLLATGEDRYDCASCHTDWCFHLIQELPKVAAFRINLSYVVAIAGVILGAGVILLWR